MQPIFYIWLVLMSNGRPSSDTTGPVKAIAVINETVTTNAKRLNIFSTSRIFSGVLLVKVPHCFVGAHQANIRYCGSHNIS